MKKLILIACASTLLVSLFTSCEKEDDLLETEAVTKEESKSFATTIPVSRHGKGTILTTLWMRDDHEPWRRGNAEMYAHIIGLDSNKQPMISTVRMPYANHDKTMYYPNQELIDWDGNNYEGGVVSIVFMEADDPFVGVGGIGTIEPIFRTIYSEDRFLNTPLRQALRIVTDDFAGEEGTGYSNNDGIIFDGADDLVDVFYNISRTRDYEVIGGAVGGSRDNVYVTLKRTFD